MALTILPNLHHVLRLYRPWYQYQVEKPLNGFMQPGSNCPGRTPSTTLHDVIYNIDICAATETAPL